LRIPSNLENENGDVHIVKQYQFNRYSVIENGNYIHKKDLFSIVSVDSNRYKNCLKDKILIAEDALRLEATYDNTKSICQGGIYFGTTIEEDYSIKYILAILNSKFINALYANLFSGMHMGGGYLRFRSSFLYELPFVHSAKQDILINLVNQILLAKQSNPQFDSSGLEKEIDQLVYQLYGLTEEEIKIVENA